MKVMVLAGGPDRERPVSLVSGAQVAAALRDAGHDVLERDLLPDDVQALDEFAAWTADSLGVVFPVFHGRWGEGGPAQALLSEAALNYVGCHEAAARRCFDKAATKRCLQEQGLPTPEFELVAAADFPKLSPPVVLKPNDDGSSIDLALCHTALELRAAWTDLTQRNEQLLVERLIAGRELTVGVLCAPGGPPTALPPIQIIPATAFYDYQAKYHRDDTQYRLDFLAPKLDARVRQLAEATFASLGCRHLARVDLFLDEDDQPWVIEVNTLPGFTTHSLLPMAARHAGWTLPKLVDQLVHWAAPTL